MIHWVIPEVDAGDVIVQRIVPLQPGDTVETFEARMHGAEHEIIVEGLPGASSAPIVTNMTGDAMAYGLVTL